MNRKILSILVYLLPVPVLLFSVLLGPSENITMKHVIQMLTNTYQGSDQEIIATVLLDVRLPRIMLVFMAGGALAASGSALQSVFRNPLVSPYVLGLSSGAAFGAALAMWTIILPVQVSAFVFGLIAVVLSYLMARKKGQVSIVSLILAGIITNGIFTALLTIVQVISDPFRLQGIVHWTMGNFHNANWQKFNAAILPVALGIAVLFIMRWKLNVLAMGDEEALSAGIHPRKVKSWVLGAATVSCSAAVAVSGIIGLYGLIIPHATRMVFGVDNKTTFLLNILIGGSFLTLIDNISRTVAGFEIPIGVFTMLIGAPFFIFLLKKTNAGWEQ